MTAAPRTWSGVVIGVADLEPGANAETPTGDIVLTRQRIQIVDHGTGAGEALAVLALTDADAAALVEREQRPSGAPTVRELAPIEVVVRPVTSPEVVEVTFTGSDQPQQWRPSSAPDRLLSMLTRRRLDDGRHHARIHAGAATDEAGRAIVIMGHSGAGKSTLTAHLVASGMRLVNDEQLTLISPADSEQPPGSTGDREPLAPAPDTDTIARGDVLVAGFTRPIAIKPGGLGRLPASVTLDRTEVPHTTLLTATQLGSLHQVIGRPAVIVIPERHPTGTADAVSEQRDTADPGHRAATDRDTAPPPSISAEEHPDAMPVAPGGTVEMIAVTPAEAVEVLCANNLDLEVRPTAALRAFAWLAATVPVFRIRYTDAADAARVLTETAVAGDFAVLDHSWAVVDHGSPANHHGGPPSDRIDERRDQGVVEADRYEASPEVLAVHIDEETVLYRRSNLYVARLNHQGSATWRRLPFAATETDAGERSFLGALAEAGLVVAPRTDSDEPDPTEREAHRAAPAPTARREPDQSGSTAPTDAYGYDTMDQSVAHESPATTRTPAGPSPSSLIPSHSVLHRAPDLVSRRLRGTVLITGRDGSHTVIDGSAAVLWTALNKPGTVTDVVNRVLLDAPDGQEADTAALHDEVRRAAEAMIDTGLLEPGDP